MSFRFEHETLGQRVVFAPRAAGARLADEVARLAGSRVMAIVTPSQRELSTSLLGQVPVAVRHGDVESHVPIEVAQRARDVAAEHEVDLLVCIGGGSATGLAKAVALTTGLPIVAVPTTYAGSEATNVWGLTENGRKTTGVDARVLPRSIVYDASLTLSLPGPLSVSSGLNALAHCVDSMWASRTDPINQVIALEGLRALRRSLPIVTSVPADLGAREELLYGAYLAAVAFASAGSGLHHKICHVLGGLYNLPHAQTHAVVLPYVLAFNAPAVPDRERRMAQAFEAVTASAGLQRLRKEVAAPTALADYGLTEADLPAAVDAILPKVPADNPVPVNARNLHELLLAALHGSDPE